MITLTGEQVGKLWDLIAKAIKEHPEPEKGCAYREGPQEWEKQVRAGVEEMGLSWEDWDADSLFETFVFRIWDQME